MDHLTLTLDEAPTYEVVALIAPPQPDWLNLPEVHARLLPLAEKAGHEKLHLTAQIGDGLPCYEATTSGGVSGFRRYISFFDYGSTPSQFERALTELLEQQVQYLHAKQGPSYAA